MGTDPQLPEVTSLLGRRCAQKAWSDVMLRSSTHHQLQHDSKHLLRVESEGFG